MPTFRSSPESEYRSTDRGSEARRKEEAKENRCPSDMEGVIGRLVNTEGTSEQYTELQCLRIRLDTDRDEGKQAKLPFPPARENRTQCQTPARATSQSSGKSMRQSAKWPNTEQPGSSITSGTRQSVREGHPRPIWSRFLPDVSRKVTRDIGQNKVRNVLLQQFQAFQTQLEHQTSCAPSGGGHVSGREAGKGRTHSRIVTPSSN